MAFVDAPTLQSTKHKQKITTHTAHAHAHTQDEPCPCHPPPSGFALPLHGRYRIVTAPDEPDSGVQRPGSGAPSTVPLFGAPKWHPKSNREGGVHRPWMVASHRVNATIKQMMALAVRGALGKRCGRAERVGDGVYLWVCRQIKGPKLREREGPGLGRRWLLFHKINTAIK